MKLRGKRMAMNSKQKDMWKHIAWGAAGMFVAGCIPPINKYLQQISQPVKDMFGGVK